MVVLAFLICCARRALHAHSQGTGCEDALKRPVRQLAICLFSLLSTRHRPILFEHPTSERMAVKHECSSGCSASASCQERGMLPEASEGANSVLLHCLHGFTFGRG